jgi:signal transduction histidine kinase
LPALADPGQIEQVLINLALNARDAMPSGGVLRIETQNLDAVTVQLAVEDTGAGISEEIRDRVFEPFFTTKPGHSGSGLGLSVAQGIVRQSGGSMSLQSAAAGGLASCLHSLLEQSSRLRGRLLGPPGRPHACCAFWSWTTNRWYARSPCAS